uniref:Uncharacterized protein n=1 Tax=Opuntia streptacantha TaxID=393608 RepID=A0A7C9D9L8_OPUST
MTTLRKFKLLATQCAVVGSPTQSPTTSPVIHIRRRKTLRMLLGRDTASRNAGNFNRRFHQPPPRSGNSPDRRSDHAGDSKRRMETGKEHFRVRLKLKDLFVSSPPPATIRKEEKSQRSLPSSASPDARFTVAKPGGGSGSIRPLSATLRQRLLMRRAWRPMLMAIPEQSP